MDNKSTNKKEAILEAAEKLFMTRGFAGTKTMAVAAEAGVTHAMLHYYFKTKKQLFEHVLVTKVHQMMNELITSFSNSDLPIKERIALGVERHFDLIAKSPDQPRFVVNEVFNNPDALPVFMKCYREMIDALKDTFLVDLQEAIAKKEIQPIMPEQLLLTVFSLNATLFMAKPVLTEMLSGTGVDFFTFLIMRRHENVRMIMNRLNYE